MATQDCIFCKIIKGEISCYKIAENEHAIAFLDNAGDVYGHTLVIPKKHYVNILDCDETELAGVMSLVKQVSNHYIKCGFKGVNILNANGESAGQSVFHLHFHIIPRRKRDKLKCFPDFPGDKTPLNVVQEKLEIKDANRKTIASKKTVVLYTDGACSNNPGIGGYCSILIYNGREKVISGGEAETTNNRMELMGVLKGLQAIKDKSKVEVYSDSAYVVNAFELGWIDSWQNHNWRTSGKTPVLNMDLWKALLLEMERLDVKFCKVKGHADDEINNRCDEIARKEVAKIKESLGE